MKLMASRELSISGQKLVLTICNLLSLGDELLPVGAILDGSNLTVILRVCMQILKRFTHEGSVIGPILSDIRATYSEISSKFRYIFT